MHVRTENSNDEPPTFIPNATYTAFVAEDAQSGTPIVQIQAIDPDRDQVFWRTEESVCVPPPPPTMFISILIFNRKLFLSNTICKFKVFYTFLLTNGEEASRTELFNIDRDTGKISGQLVH